MQVIPDPSVLLRGKWTTRARESPKIICEQSKQEFRCPSIKA
jgi:hypothetical protein